MAHDVFISYSSKDKVIADAIVSTLENNQIRCWYAPRDIEPGDDWGEAISTAIEKCSVFLLIFSSYANRSQRVLDEVNLAISQELSIIPFRIEKLEPKGAMKLHLSSRHWLDAYDPSWQAYLRKLVSKIFSNLSVNVKESEVLLPDLINKVKSKKLALYKGIAALITCLIAAWYLLPPTGFGLPNLLISEVNSNNASQISDVNPQGRLTQESTQQEPATNHGDLSEQDEIYEMPNPDYYEFCLVGNRCEDRDISNESEGVMDVLWLETSLEGETLNISFQLGDIPEKITVNRDAANIDMPEYSWSINIDLDGDPTTGYDSFLRGIEYFFQIYYFKDTEGEESKPFEEAFDAVLYENFDDHSAMQVNETEYMVDFENNIVSSSIEVPGISENSVLYMNTYDSANAKLGDDLDNIRKLQLLGIFLY